MGARSLDMTCGDIVRGCLCDGWFVVKMVALSPSVYISRSIHYIDLLAVAASISALFSYAPLRAAKAFRALRVLRPICVLTQSEELFTAVSTMLCALPGILSMLCVCLFVATCFVVMGVAAFRGRETGWCSDGSHKDQVACESVAASTSGCMVGVVTQLVFSTVNGTESNSTVMVHRGSACVWISSQASFGTIGEVPIILHVRLHAYHIPPPHTPACEAPMGSHRGGSHHPV